jgi:hypothetical protein
MIDFEKKQVVDLLIKFMIDNNFCPSVNKIKIDESILEEIAKRNKITHHLFHFLNCKNCKAKISKKFCSKIKKIYKKRVLNLLLYQQELAIFNKLIKKNNKPAVIFKRNNTDPTSASDIDVLILEKDLFFFIEEYKKIGYKASKIFSDKEVHITNPITKFSIDLHFLIAHPHYKTISKKEKRSINKISKDIIKTHFLKENESSISKELMLASTIIRYWHNDLLCGLKTLKDIMLLLNSFQEPKEINRLIILLKKYEILNYAFFTFQLGSKVFSTPIPDKILDKTPYLIKRLNCMISKYEISIFPDILKWYDDDNLNWVKKYYNKLNIIKIILNEEVPLTRKIRPQIIIVFLNSIFKNRVNYFFSFCKKKKNSPDLIGN